MKKTAVPIQGMHCRSCELLITDELMQIPGVERVTVSYRDACATLYHSKPVAQKTIRTAVRLAGYRVGVAPKKPWFSSNINDYIQVGSMIFIGGIALFIAKDTGLLNIGDFASNNLGSYPVVLMLGVAAGFSTCAALVGALVLAVSARFAEKHPESSVKQKFIPHVFFNMGRIVSFLVLGSLIGMVGSFFQMSLGVMGFFTMLIGVMMLIFGAQLIDLFPRLSSLSFTLPSSVAHRLRISKKTDQAYTHTNAFWLGALTFFLPCGFTQLVQLYAISTANPVTAGLTMAIFAVGTTPGLLGIGGLTAIVKGSVAKPFFRFAGLVVIGLALVNIANGYTLSGLKSLLSSPAADIQISAEPQILTSIYTSKEDLQPSTFTVRAGQPVRFEIDVRDDGFGCMGSMALPGFSSQVEMLVKGKPMVFEFVPKKKGTYDITCAMGVPRGTITVI